MLLDKGLTFSDAQNLAQIAGTYKSDFTYDTYQGASANVGSPPIGGPLVGDLGRSLSLDLTVQVVTTFTSAGAPTFQVQLIQCDAEDGTGNIEVLAETRAHALADLVAGKYFGITKVPPGVTRRYIGFQYVIGTATTTAGKVSAWIGKGRQTNRSQV